MKKTLFIISLILSGVCAGIVTSRSLSRLTQDLLSLTLLKTNLPCTTQGAKASISGGYIESLTCIIPAIGKVNATEIHLRPTLSREIKATGSISQGRFTSLISLNSNTRPRIAIENIDLSEFDSLKNNFALTGGTISMSLDGNFEAKDLKFDDLSKKLPLPESLSTVVISSLQGNFTSTYLPTNIKGTFITPEGSGEFQTEIGELTCKGNARFTLNEQGVNKYGTVLRLLNSRASIKKDSPISLNFSGKYTSPQLSLISD